MKKLLIIFLILINLFACASNKQNDDEVINIVTSSFSAYDWTKELTKGTNVKITYLLDNGLDLHNFQPSALDMITISNSDLFIYVGGESDKWVDDALAQAENKNMKVINLLEILGDKAKKEELKEGMQEDEHEEKHEAELDEHVWLSLKNVSIYIEEIKNKLIELDNNNSNIYENNYKNYLNEINKLDYEYDRIISSAKTKTIIMADRFPFRYLVEDYGLDYYAAFLGCSAETEASFETIAFLTDKLDELDLDYILVLENSDFKIAKTIISNSQNKNAEIEILDSIQSTTTKDNKSYLAIMKNNLTTLERILNS